RVLADVLRFGDAGRIDWLLRAPVSALPALPAGDIDRGNAQTRAPNARTRMKHDDASYGVMAEFATPQALLDAVHRCRSTSFRHLEAYSPFSIDGLHGARGFTRNRVPLLTLIGGLLGWLGRYSWHWCSA